MDIKKDTMPATTVDVKKDNTKKPTTNRDRARLMNATLQKK